MCAHRLRVCTSVRRNLQGNSVIRRIDCGFTISTLVGYIPDFTGTTGLAHPLPGYNLRSAGGVDRFTDRDLPVPMALSSPTCVHEVAGIILFCDSGNHVS